MTGEQSDSWLHNLLPVCIQNGMLPSVRDKCGPLKLYLYSKRLWGASGSDVAAPAAMLSHPILFNVINNSDMNR